MENLKVSIEKLNTIENTIKVNLEGKLSDVVAYKFKSNLLELLKKENKDCIIDVRELGAMDIIGMNALAIAHRQLEATGQRLTVLSKEKSQIDKVFSLTKFDQILNLQRA